MTDPKDPKLQRAFKQAQQAAAQLLPDSYDYQTTLVRDDPDVWVVQLSPEERVRGHTAQFIINRDKAEIVEVIYLQ